MTYDEIQALIDQAVAELEQTTVGFTNTHWTTPPAGTHWANGLNYLAQARAALVPVEPPPPSPPPPPALTVTQSILGGSTITTPTKWTATPSAPVTKVEFFVDGVLKWTEGAAPYQFNGDPSGVFDPASVADGPHTLSVKATDSTGKTATATVTVTTQKPVTPPPPPPPPPATGRYWGFCFSPDSGGAYTQAGADKQIGELAALMAGKMDRALPRLTGHDFAAASARAHGFKQWTVLAGLRSFDQSTVDWAVAYAKKWPEAWLEWGNEINQWMSPENYATMCLFMTSKVRAAVSGVKILMPSMCNCNYSAEALAPLPYVKRVKAKIDSLGKKVSDCFDLDGGNFHAYSTDPAGYDRWQHVVTPDANGDSMVKVLGLTGWFMTEFGEPLSSLGGDVNRQKAACDSWMLWLKAQAGCRGGMWYSMSDYAPGTGSGYGLCDKSWNRRPAWFAYQAEAV